MPLKVQSEESSHHLAIGKQQIERIGHPKATTPLNNAIPRNRRLVSLKHRYRYTNHNNFRNIKPNPEDEEFEKEFGPPPAPDNKP